MQLITPRRVKVYILNGEDWIDNGTGYCTGEIDDKNNIPFFLVRNELDQSDIILKLYIEGTTQYQQQQETLIVWTDELGRDILLSFQEPNGCTSLCDFLIEVFQNYQPNISLVAVISNNNEGGNGNDITELIVGPVELPPTPTMKNLQTVLEILNQGSSSNYSRDQISNYLLENDCIPKLIEIFGKCELGHKLSSLHFLCDIIKILFMYSNTQIIEVLLNDANIMGVVGILEYDPEFPEYKSNHREYLSDETKFKEVIPIQDLKILKKIKSTFRLHFLKDVVLLKLIDDATFNLIQALIYFNQFDVIKFLQEPNGYMELLFLLYQDPELDIEKKRDGVRMLHQFVLILKTLQMNQKTEFFKSVVAKGLFKMINFSLQDDCTNVRVLCTELIVSIIEHDVMLVNELYGNGNQLTNDMTLMKLLTKLLIEEKDIGLKTQLFELIKVLLDPWNASNNHSLNLGGYLDDDEEEEEEEEAEDDDEHHNEAVSDLIGESNGNGTTNGASSDNNTTESKHKNRISTNNSRNGTDISSYIDHFYAKVAPKLFKPFIKLSQVKSLTEKANFIDIIDNQDISDSILFQHLCELVNFCITKHERHISRDFFLGNDILKGLKNLVDKTFKMQLRLLLIRTIKSVISLDDESYTAYVINNDILQYVTQFDLTCDTLLTSTVLSIIEIEDTNKDTEEKKKHYDLMMSYINKLIKFEEEELIEDVEKEEVMNDLVEEDAEISEEVPKQDQVAENVDIDAEVDKKHHDLKEMADITDENKLKREVSASTTLSSSVKSKKIKWVKKFFNKKNND